MRGHNIKRSGAAGFSLIELMIAMVITLTVMGIATTLIARSLKVRARENRQTDALADAQRALNLMTREIANSGYRMKTNGIVWEDSNNDTSIRVLANLNKYTGETDNGVTEEGEDVKFFLTNDKQSLVRYDPHATDPDLRSTVLANRINGLNIYYYAQRVDYTLTGNCAAPVISGNGVARLTNANIANATYVVLSICVDLPAEGSPGSPGYHPATQALLVSDVALRNPNINAY